MAESGGRSGGPRLWAALALTATVAFLGVMAWQGLRPPADDPLAQCRGGQVAGDLGGPFTLVDETGRTVTDAELVTGPTLVYFGFTYCPDVCPLDAARNAEATDILEEMGIEATPLFISFDPGRDTPELLRDFTDNLHPRMVGLTGSEDQLRAAMQAFRIYAKVRDPAEEYYVYDHSTMTYLLMPGLGYVDFFRNETSAQEMAERTACFVQAAAGN